MTIGQNIKKFREAKNLTQMQLAEKVGIARPAITQFERGSRVPNMPIGEAIAKALDCTINDLIR